MFTNLTETPLLQNRLYQWLVGGIPSLSSFSTFDFSSTDNVKKVLTEYAGLTWTHLQQVLQAQLGAGNYAAATKIATLLFGEDLAQENPPPLWDFLANLPAQVSALGPEFQGLINDLFNWQELSQELFNKAKAQLVATLAQVAPRLLAKFVPGVGVAQSLYQGLSFLLANQSQMGDLFTGFFNGIDHLVDSLTNPDSVGQYTQRLVEAIEGPGLDLLLNFAAAQLGLNSLRTDLQKVINYLPKKVDELMRPAVAAIAAKLVNVLPDSLGNAGGLYAGQMAPPATFTYNGTSYTLWVAKDRTGTKVKVASGTNLIGVLTPASFDNAVVPNSRQHLLDLVSAAQAMASAGDVRTMATRQAALSAAQSVVIADILNNACRVLNNAACFAAGTKLWTPQGFRNVEDIQSGELVYARDEYDPFGPIEAKQVEEKFERTGRILHLHLPEGKLIRTTPEHPFFVYDKGWTVAGALQAGDCIRTDAGWVAVEEVYDTNTHEKVHNLRVADYHTYFVGDWDWRSSVWSHNVICGNRESSTARNLSYARSSVDDPAITNPANQILQAERRARGMPRAGTSADNATLAYLQIVGDSQPPIFASNSDAYTYDFPTVGTGPGHVPVGQGVNPQGRLHAEVKALIHAVQSGVDLTGKSLIIFTDRDPCIFCDKYRAIENAARIFGAVSITIWCPSGRIGPISL